jgi:hypothetical protein
MTTAPGASSAGKRLEFSAYRNHPILRPAVQKPADRAEDTLPYEVTPREI